MPTVLHYKYLPVERAKLSLHVSSLRKMTGTALQLIVDTPDYSSGAHRGL